MTDDYDCGGDDAAAAGDDDGAGDSPTNQSESLTTLQLDGYTLDSIHTCNVHVVCFNLNTWSMCSILFFDNYIVSYTTHVDQKQTQVTLITSKITAMEWRTLCTLFCTFRWS